MEIFLTKGAIQEITSTKSIYVESGGDGAIIKPLSSSGPIILKILGIENNFCDLFDGIDKKKFLFWESSIKEATKTRKLIPGSCILVDQIYIKKNADIEIASFFHIGIADVDDVVVEKSNNNIKEISKTCLKRKLSFESNKDDVVPNKISKIFTHSLEQINPDLKIWSCVVKLENRTKLTTSRSNIDLVKFLFTDGKKFFEAIAYGQEALKFDANLKIGNSYHFENGKIEIPKKLSLRTWANPNNIDYDVTITRNTLIEFFEAKSCSEEIKVTEKENDDFKENKTNKINDGFYKIKDLINVNLTKFKNLQPTVNVIGIIESINELKSIDTKNGPIDCLNFCLIDDEGIYVNCAMWGKQASYFKYKVGQVLIFRNVRVTSYGGCSLSIEKITEISLKPADSNEEQYYKELEKWWSVWWIFRQKNKQNSVNSLLSKKNIIPKSK